MIEECNDPEIMQLIDGITDSLDNALIESMMEIFKTKSAHFALTVMSGAVAKFFAIITHKIERNEVPLQDILGYRAATINIIPKYWRAFDEIDKECDAGRCGNKDCIGKIKRCSEGLH